MPRLQVYLPQDLYDELKSRELPASELLQIAVRAEVERQSSLDETQHYLDELEQDVGVPSKRTRSQAEAIAMRIRSRSLNQAS